MDFKMSIAIKIVWAYTPTLIEDFVMRRMPVRYQGIPLMPMKTSGVEL